MKNFASTIRNRRLQIGMTQRYLAKIIELDYTYLSTLENGRNSYPPSEQVIHKLALTLSLDYNELLLSSGRIESNSYLLFKVLAEKYPQFTFFMKKLAVNEDFANCVFKQLDTDDEALIKHIKI